MDFNIKERLQKIKPLENNIIVASMIILVAIIAFGLGRLSALSERKTPITMENLTSAVVETAQPLYNSASSEESIFVASKNGTKYHYAWCSGAERIKEENKIWFKTKEEAEKAGYTPASNCPGL